jgi:hypothetical protein
MELTVHSCQNAVVLVFPNSITVTVSHADVLNRPDDVASQLRIWLAQWRAQEYCDE